MTIRRLSILLILLLLALAGTGTRTAADTVYPSGAAVTARHALNTASLRGGDTLIIQRSLINHGNAPLTGVYFSQTLPGEFYVIGAAITLNGSVIATTLADKPVDPVMSGYVTYHWVIDDPTYELPLHHWIEPGDSLAVTIRTVCGHTGQYVLPDRSATFFTNGTPGFAVMDAPPPVVTIETCCLVRGNVDGIYGAGGPVDVSDLSYLVNFLFRAGPPPPCAEEANADASTGGGAEVNVGDLSFLVEYLFRAGSAPLPCGN